MSITKPVQLPLSIDTKQKRNARSQFGALCYRITDGKIQVLLSLHGELSDGFCRRGGLKLV